MKKGLLLIGLILVGFGIGINVNAYEYYYQSFDGLSEGEMAPQDSHWTGISHATSGYSNTPSNSLLPYYATTTPASNTLFYPESTINGDFTVSFYFRFVNASGIEDFEMYQIQGGFPPSGLTSNYWIKWRINGGVCSVNYTGNIWETGTDIEFDCNTWHSFRITGSFTDNLLTFTVDGTESPEYQFNGTSTEKFWFYNGQGTSYQTSAPFYIDDFEMISYYEELDTATTTDITSCAYLYPYFPIECENN